MRRFWSIAGIALIIGMLGLSTQVSHAVDVTVYTEDELVDAINAANVNGQDDVIYFANDIVLTTVRDTLFGNSGLPLILEDGGSSLTFEGNGFEISPQTGVGGLRIFTLNEFSNVIINDLTVHSGGSLIGGALYSRNARFTIDNSYFYNNYAADYGGAIATQSGGPYFITNSRFDVNFASDGAGAIFNDSEMTIFNTVFFRNEIICCLGGGAIHNDIGNLAITSSQFLENSATAGSPFGGGALVNISGNVIIRDSDFTRNTVTGGDGGAIVSGDVLTTITSIYNSRFTQNYAGFDGGAIYVNPNNMFLEIYTSTIEGNQSGMEGGGVAIEGGAVNIIDSTIANNFGRNGGGVWIGNFNAIIPTLFLNNSTISGNVARDNGGGLAVEVIDGVANATILHNTIIGNQSGAGFTGDGIYVQAGGTGSTELVIANNIVLHQAGEDCVNAGGAVTINGVNNLTSDGAGCPDAGVIIAGTHIDPVLADNGGVTQTHALLDVPANPAVDVIDLGGSPSPLFNHDQRGTSIVNLRDVGAYELNGTVPTLTFTIDEITLYERDGQTIATVTVTPSSLGEWFDVAYLGIFEILFIVSGTADEADYSFSIVQNHLFYYDNNNDPFTFTVTIVDDNIAESLETLTLDLHILVGSADIISPNPQTITIIDPSQVPVAIVNPQIDVFDPAISKLGFLVPDQTGVTGEQLEWVVTVSNTGNVAGQNVIVTDTLIDALRIDSVDAPNGIVSINGQTVSVTYPTLNTNETTQFSIFTTVLDGVNITNTACVNADNQGVEECATGAPITLLPATGESPVWRVLLIGVLMVFSVLMLSVGGFVKYRRYQSA